MNRTRHQESGFTLLEVIVALAVMTTGLVLLNSLLVSSAERDRETLTAQHMKRVVDASERYIKDNNAALIASATATAPVVLTIATLKGASYLPSAFADNNAHQQSYQIRVLEPTAGQLSTLIVTNGGEVMKEGSLRRVARQVGPEGGYVTASSTTTATGAYGAWSMPLATYGASNGAGRLAAGLFFRDGQQVSDYIYRSAVAGRPELNTMNASINMAGNNVANAGQVTATGEVQGATVRATGRLYADEYVMFGKVEASGGSCSPNGLMARVSSGRPLACVSGRWTSL